MPKGTDFNAWLNQDTVPMERERFAPPSQQQLQAISQGEDMSKKSVYQQIRSPEQMAEAQRQQEIAAMNAQALEAARAEAEAQMNAAMAARGQNIDPVATIGRPYGYEIKGK